MNNMQSSNSPIIDVIVIWCVNILGIFLVNPVQVLQIIALFVSIIASLKVILGIRKLSDLKFWKKHGSTNKGN